MKKGKDRHHGTGAARGMAFFLLAAVFSLQGIGLPAAWSEGAKYPSRPITIINPSAAGGTADIQTRGIQPYLQKILGVPIVVESVAGGGGIVGYTNTFKSKPDGYTIMFWPHLRAGMVERLQKIQYKTLEFTPIFAMADQPLAWVVNPKTYAGLPQFLEAAKTKTMNVGTSGYGSVAHLHAILVSESLKFKAKYVPFGGGAESLTALVGGHVDAVATSVGSSLGLVNSGVLKILFIAAEKRDPLYKEFPTAEELEYTIPPLHFAHGFAGPPKMDRQLVKTLEDAFFKAKGNPEFQAWAEKVKLHVIGLNAEEYKTMIERECKLIDKYIDKFKEQGGN